MVNNSDAVTMCPVPDCNEPLHYEEGAEHPYCEKHGDINLSLYVCTTPGMRGAGKPGGTEKKDG